MLFYIIVSNIIGLVFTDISVFSPISIIFMRNSLFYSVCMKINFFQIATWYKLQLQLRTIKSVIFFERQGTLQHQHHKRSFFLCGETCLWIPCWEIKIWLKLNNNCVMRKLVHNYIVWSVQQNSQIKSNKRKPDRKKT